MIKILRNIFLKKKTQKVDIIPSAEKICRFAHHKSKITVRDNQLKYTAFIPPRIAPCEISVLRINSLKEDDIWNIGDKLLGKNSPKYRGEMLAENIRAIKCQNLDILSEPTPHLLHANIVGIPKNTANDPDEKSRQKLVAMELADCTVLISRRVD